MRNQAFTLIELLVVIAMIAILFAIVHPSISTSNARAQRTTCASNLHRVGISAAMYAEDHQVYPASLATLDREIIRDRTAIRCSRTDRPYYYSEPAPKADPESILSACTPPEAKLRYPHDAGDVNVAVRVNGKLILLRR